MRFLTIRAALIAAFLSVAIAPHGARGGDSPPAHLVLPAKPSAPGPIKALPLLHEGMQLTFSTSTTTLPGNVEQVISAHPGTLDDPNSGWTVYTKNTRSTGVMGPVEMTIARIDGDQVVITSEPFNSFSPAFPASAPPASAGKLSSIFHPGDATLVSGYWLEPAKMDEYFKMPPQGCKAVRGPWKIADHTFDAVIFNSHQATIEFVTAYDAQTGLLLHRGVISQGPPPLVVVPGQVPRGNVMLQFQDLAADRDLNIPWAGEPMPPWVAQTKVLHFQGSYASGTLPPLPKGFDISITTNTNGWAGTETTTIVGNQRISGTLKDFWGPAQFGGLWAGPAALARLKTGQVLDDDPVTKMQTVVSYVDGKSVAIAQSNQTGERDWSYHKATGMLLGRRSILRVMLPLPRIDTEEAHFVATQ